ncbi:uncharacterized protein LOC126604347 isoform X1 [Malus sylvestris]|uniref:uncharacterized protein isoform X1 n=1 Tax=Malus domestica TaxID=3750 RepID=UPI0004992E9B|nr:uncharacterized protein LOC103456125 isoform X1 [Malus domestica]XP_050127523.1 uncharacterized protein LOC126604347 isoform X1 [Malus sylvestris]
MEIRRRRRRRLGNIEFSMGGVLCRAVEVVNDTDPGVELAMTEVEGNETQGTEILRLGPGERRMIKGRQFIKRSSISKVHRSIHVTPVLASGERAKKVLSANHFARHGKVTFRIVEGELTNDSVEISDLRRLRFSACLGGNRFSACLGGNRSR